MGKKFVTRKQKKKRHYKFLFFFFTFCLGIYLSFYFLNKSNIKLKDETVAKFLIDALFDNKILMYDKEIFKKITPVSFLENNYYEVNIPKKEESPNKEEDDKTPIIEKPLIYIYNSHQTESYSPSTFAEFSVNPTVMVADYILADIFNKNNFNTIVEEGSIKEILNQNNWRYSYSYKASRLLMESAKSKNPSLTYFIDVHRDSLEKNRTTVSINGRSYAKTIFLIGLENPNYEKNLQFTIMINDKMNEKYPGLSKGIYKKGGTGVNGVYNQDFSNHTILIEIGGYENSLSEVLNSVLAFADCFMEVLNEQI